MSIGARRRRRWPWIALALVGLLVAVAPLPFTRWGRALRAGASGMHALAGDPRVLAEPGAEAAAEAAAGALDGAIAAVEAAHGRPFEGPVRIHACATQASFNLRTALPASSRATGAVFAGRLFLSPRAHAEGRLPGILAHELSHLHLRQTLGTRRVVTGIPGWFQEGLAVHASGGGGAEPVPPGEALAALRAGRGFVPEDRGSLRPRTAADHGLPHHLFYRQAGLFVDHLARRHPEGFRAFMDALLDGAPFAAAFGRLGTDVAGAWREFLAEVAEGGRAPPGPLDAGGTRR